MPSSLRFCALRSVCRGLFSAGRPTLECSLMRFCSQMQIRSRMYASGMAAEAAARAPGLRERNKQRRQDAVVRAAYRLFAERGYDATTVADIAAAAEVAPRTVATYFASKQDIAMARFSDLVNSLTSALCERAPAESVTDVIGRWL